MMNGYSCDRCGKTFARSNNLKRHLEKKFQCDEIQDHFDQNDFICEKCFKLFRRKDNLVRHMETCKKEIKIDDNQCEFCDKTYLNRSNLKRHLQTCKMRIFVKQKNNIQIDNSSDKTNINGDHNNVNKINVDKSQNQNNTINQTNIHQTIINKYGSENTDYIDENFFKYLLKIPYGGIPKLIQMTHYHPDHPENHNLLLTNKKLKFINTWNGKRWFIKNKNNIINDLISSSYVKMDEKYDQYRGELNHFKRANYTKFRKDFENPSNKFMRNMKNDVEVVLINYTKQIPKPKNL